MKTDAIDDCMEGMPMSLCPAKRGPGRPKKAANVPVKRGRQHLSEDSSSDESELDTAVDVDEQCDMRKKENRNRVISFAKFYRIFDLLYFTGENRYY